VTPDAAAQVAGGGLKRRALEPVVPVPEHLWAPDGPTDASVAPALWDALRAAVERGAERWEDIAAHAASPADARNRVALAGAAMRARLAGVGWDALPRTDLSRRAVEVIRAAFIEYAARLAPAPDSAQLLRCLGAIEQVARDVEPDWSTHFSDRLAAPDGLELVVEVAHDLRSPLTSILFLAETLQRGRSGPVTDVQERQLGLIYSAAFGLSSVASDVIELARGGDRLVDLDPIPFSVSDILESVRDIVLPIAEEKGLTVRVTAPGSDFRVGHPVALSRVLLNLTTNALKFTDEGGVDVTCAELDATRVEFAVRDTGRGIPPHAMATLYEPFRRRQHPGEYTFSGSGLGLSICRKLVEAMGGPLDVDTELGAGTRFHFVLDLPLAGHP
jgi:signal transduction histidine kinase